MILDRLYFRDTELWVFIFLTESYNSNRNPLSYWMHSNQPAARQSKKVKYNFLTIKLLNKSHLSHFRHHKCNIKAPESNALVLLWDSDLTLQQRQRAVLHSDTWIWDACNVCHCLLNEACIIAQKKWSWPTGGSPQSAALNMTPVKLTAFLQREGWCSGFKIYSTVRTLRLSPTCTFFYEAAPHG